MDDHQFWLQTEIPLKTLVLPIYRKKNSVTPCTFHTHVMDVEV
jgi:hypothetical protein